jgi:hypothetical protein
MNKKLIIALTAALGIASSAFAAAPNSYQVTGPIVELTDTTIVVMKGKDKWELARTADTKVTGELKVGAKVTIEYSMTAKTIEAKEEKAKGAKDAVNKAGDTVKDAGKKAGDAVKDATKPATDKK